MSDDRLPDGTLFICGCHYCSTDEQAARTHGAGCSGGPAEPFIRASDLIEVRNDGVDVAADGSGDTLAYFVAVLPFGTPIPEKALLVRPRGEATDA